MLSGDDASAICSIIDRIPRREADLSSVVSQVPGPSGRGCAMVGTCAGDGART